jgi:hypothetical protein
VTDLSIERLLELVQRQLGAEDARVEIGGKDPSDPRQLFCGLPSGARLVVCFDEPPPDRAEAQARLAALAEAFGATGDRLREERPVASDGMIARRLDDELVILADATGAVATVVVDDKSPVLWGSSLRRLGDEDVDAEVALGQALQSARGESGASTPLWEAAPATAIDLLRQVGVPAPVVRRLEERLERLSDATGAVALAPWRAHLSLACALAEVRALEAFERDGLTRAAHRVGYGYLARPFAAIYRLVLVFEGEFSELHAEGRLIRALPAIERLVMALPPVNPPRGTGRVIPLRRT